jgi:hypothetical protein
MLGGTGCGLRRVSRGKRLAFLWEERRPYLPRGLQLGRLSSTIHADVHQQELQKLWCSQLRTAFWTQVPRAVLLSRSQKQTAQGPAEGKVRWGSSQRVGFTENRLEDQTKLANRLLNQKIRIQTNLLSLLRDCLGHRDQYWFFFGHIFDKLVPLALFTHLRTHLRNSEFTFIYREWARETTMTN